jgi:hypothetical protein
MKKKKENKPLKLIIHILKTRKEIVFLLVLAVLVAYL